MKRFAVLALLALAGCGGGGALQPPPPATPLQPGTAKAPPADGVRSLSPAAFEDLPGWSTDRVAEALPALSKSCAVLNKRAPGKPIGADAATGRGSDWQPACRALAELTARGAPGDDATRDFLARWFRPWTVGDQGRADGLFTGYYEASLKGSRHRHGAYQTPLLKPPAAPLVTFNPRDFDASLPSLTLTGMLVKDRLIPKPDRAAIADGAIDDVADAILYADDPVDAFFLEIQGSGIVEMDDGSQVRLGYAAQNGFPYTAIGKVLRERGLLERPVTMDKIRSWLAAHPAEAQAMMNENRSYVYFREMETGPEGAQGVVLTPGRSLAVDRRYVPLGAPVWLVADGPAGSIERLVVAQDTGGAIKGVVRGDLFWGHGADAAAHAGAMQGAGRFWLLLPAGLDPR